MNKERYEAVQSIKLLSGLIGSESLSDRTVVHRAADARDAVERGSCRETAGCALCAVAGVTCELVNELAAWPHDGSAVTDKLNITLRGNKSGFAG